MSSNAYLEDRLMPTPAERLTHQLPSYIDAELNAEQRNALTSMQLCSLPSTDEELSFLDKAESVIPAATQRRSFLTRWYRLLSGGGSVPDSFEIVAPSAGMRGDGLPYVVQPSISAASLTDRASPRSTQNFAAPNHASAHAIHLPDCGLCQETAGELDRLTHGSESERVFLFRSNFVLLPEPFPRFLGECVIARPGHDPSFWPAEERPSPSVHTLIALLNLASELDGSFVRGHPRVKMSIPGHAHSHFVPVEFASYPALDAAMLEAHSGLIYGQPFLMRTLPFEAIAVVGSTVERHATSIFDTLTSLDARGIPYILAHSRATSLIIPCCPGDDGISLRGALLNFSSHVAAIHHDWRGLFVKGTLGD